MARGSKAPFVHLAPYGQGNRHEALQIAHKRGKGKNQHRGILRKTGLITGYCRKMAGMWLRPVAQACSACMQQRHGQQGLWGKGVLPAYAPAENACPKCLTKKWAMVKPCGCADNEKSPVRCLFVPAAV